MLPNSAISWEVVIALIAIFGSVWQLNRAMDSKIAALRADIRSDNTDLRKEFKADNAKLRQEVKAEIAELRTEVKADNAKLRTEVKAEIAELRTEVKAEIAELRTEVKAVDAKVDASNQRLARLEGVILSREGLVDAITETDSTA